MELCCRQMKYHLVPWNSMELWNFHFMAGYPGLPRNIPRNSTEFWSRQIKKIIKTKSPISMGFYGIMREPSQMTHVPWNSMLYSMEVWCRQMKYHLVPWNSMELWDCLFILCHATLDFHGIYHGIPWNSIKWPKKITEFHGIPWN